MALTRVYGRVVYPHGSDTPTPVTGDGVIEYVHATPGIIDGAVHGPDRHRIEYVDGVAGEAWLKAGMWRAYVYPSEGRSYTLHLGVPEGGETTIADAVGEIVPEGIVTKGDPGEPGEPGEPGRDGQDGQDGHTPEITFDGTTIVVDGTPGPDLKGDPGEGGGGIAGAVPIFATLAEAQAWEAANPGKIALTLEGQEPTEPDEPPIPGFLQVLPSDVSAALTVSGASDAEGAVEYSFRADGGAWSEWQSAPSFTATGLTRDTDYAFQHRVRDEVGNVAEGVAVSAKTLTEAPVPYQQLALSYSPKMFFPGPIGKNLGSLPVQMFKDTGTEGAPLGGFPTSRRLPANTNGWAFRADSMPADWPEWSSIFLVNLTAGEPETNADFLSTNGNPESLAYVGLGRQGATSGPAKIRLGYTYTGSVTVPGSTGAMLVGIECDGASVRYYLNGVQVGTGTARSVLRTAGRHGMEPGSMSTGDVIEAAGWLVHDRALGAAAHLALAEAAGVA